MKWFEIEGVPEGSLLVHLGNNRIAKLLKKRGPPLMNIDVRYLNGEVDERVNPKDFARLKAPPGTIARTNDSS